MNTQQRISDIALRHSGGHSTARRLDWMAVLSMAACLAWTPLTGLAQIQLGSDIDGEATFDKLSTVSLSSNGNRLAIGTGSNDGTGDGIDRGHVRVYQWSGSAWTQIGADIDGEAAGDMSGDAISLSSDGRRVAIGAIWNSGGGSYRGHVRVYQWSGTAWTQMGADIDGTADFDHSGGAVSLSFDGSRLAVVAADNDGFVSGAGQVRVFQWTGTEWLQMGADIYGEKAGDAMSSVSLSSHGDHVAIGASGNDGTGNMAGHTRVFEWTGDSWVQLGADIDGDAAGDMAGWSVSLAAAGDRVAVGALGHDANGPESGRVRVYEWSGTAWLPVGDALNGVAAGDYFGNAVSLSASGNRLAIGAYDHGGEFANSGRGQVRVYQWSSSSWSQIGLPIDGEAEADLFGYGVSLSGNGDRFAASAPQNDGNGESSGHARVFDMSSFNEFVINPGLNDHWYNPLTTGQGVYITVFPDLGKVTLTMFTYDTLLPDESVTANLGDPSQRWLNALGNYSGDQAVLNVSFDCDGIFDAPDETTKIRDYGTITLTFDSCNSGTLEYDIPSLGLSGVIPIERIAADNITACEAFAAGDTPW